MPRPTAWGIHHFALHGEHDLAFASAAGATRCRLPVVRDAPCPVSAQIGNEQLGTTGDGHDVVRVRTLLTIWVDTCAPKLQQGHGAGTKRVVGEVGR
jgi:hypothetical protein